jgi:general secretion pathway protein A
MVTSIYFINYRPNIIKQTLLTSTVKPVEQFAIPKLEKNTPPIEKTNRLPIETPPSFAEWISNPSYSLDAALINVLKGWSKTIPDNAKINCHTLEKKGLRCVLGQANWKDILALKQPVILEFTLTDNKKHHALITGFGQNQTVIHFANKISYPVADVLKYWDGYYLSLTAPPAPIVSEIKSHQASDDVLWLRYVLNTFDEKSVIVDKPRIYDNELSVRIKNFQHQHHLTEDGKVGAKTLEQLKALARTFDFSQLEITT